ncbi:hypothetical protein DPMN_137549 [Dreissena polymorpha]|uniref:Uncharacterized protein n=1 Tax=Dreissena polymorpha TaxID=45954 RepID=A0A9D4G5N8_DREPO|nr:hypothetical protein DPMN_137549 [Dreissena polymorpha]
MPRPLGGHVFQPTETIFKLVQDTIGTNLLNKFHEDWTINVASRLFTGLKNALLSGGHVFKATVTIFQLVQYIIGTNLQNKFHDDLKINVASRVLTRTNALQPYIIEMNLPTKFHQDWTINVPSRVKNAPPLGRHSSSDNHLVDGPTYRPTYRPTDRPT